ncbi:MAG: beta-galactosidase [Fervidobacterium sp.]|uniref:beta-galactosidase n=1 Tax=Fervidobacterium sp. TaxID=1871331 RepID=UPI004049AC24
MRKLGEVRTRRLEVKDAKFVLDGKERVFFSAELHYFRVNPSEWEDRVIKIKDAGFDSVSSYVPWFWHEYEEGRFDFSGVTDPRRNLIGFLQLLEKYDLGLIFKPGPYIMSELKNEGLPFWIYNAVPQAIARTIDGKQHPTRVFSYLHPDYLRFVERWYKNVAEIIRAFNNVWLVQIDNEVGMLQWITTHGDYNEDTIQKFRNYLEEKGLVECVYELNNWSYGKVFSHRLVIEYHLFIRQYYKEYLETLKRYLEESGIDLPVIVNIHGFDMVEYAKRGKRYPIGVSQLYSYGVSENVLLSGDYYIGNVVHENFSDLAIANAIMYAVQNRNQPLFSAEFQSGFQLDKPKLLPSTLELTSLQCVGNGMNGINYYMFVGGINPEGSALMGSYHDWQAPISLNGELRRGYFVLKNLIAKVRQFEPDIAKANPVFDTYFGFIPEYYSTEHFKEHGIDVSDLEFKRDVSIFDGVIRGLKLLNYNFGGINLSNTASVLDPSSVKSLWVFSYKRMPLRIQKALVDYVKHGGKLVIFPEIPVEDESGNECRVLMDVLEIDGITKFGWNMVQAFNIEINAFHVDVYKLSGKHTAFAYNEDSEICGFVKEIGKGKVVVLGFGLELEREYKLDIVRRVCELLNIERNFEVECQDFVDVYVRKSDNKCFIFVNNYDDYDKDAIVSVNGQRVKVKSKARSGEIIPIDLD